MKYMSNFWFTLEKKPLDVGYDLKSPDDYYVPPFGYVEIDTGVSIDFDDNTYATVHPRSSGSTRNIKIANTIGIIDPSYRGPKDTIKVRVCRSYLDPIAILLHLLFIRRKKYFITKGEKFAQLVFHEVKNVDLELGGFKNEERGGFGTTGTH